MRRASQAKPPRDPQAGPARIVPLLDFHYTARHPPTIRMSPRGTPDRRAGVAVGVNGSSGQPVARAMSRRRFLSGSLFLAAAAAAAGGGAALLDSRRLALERHEVALPGLSPSLDGMRVAQLSDLHRGPLVPAEEIAAAAEAAMAAEPDLVVLTGDFVSLSSANIDSCVEALRALRAPLGVYGVPGNHDHSVGVGAVAARLKAAGVPLLVNRSIQVERDLFLAGVDDLWSGNARPDIALRGIPARAARILLSHNPSLLDGLDEPLLLLAGHTHGGQINLGGLTGLFTAAVTSHGRFLSGWYSRGRTRMYVNRGIGVVGIPVRFRSRPEVTLFTLRAG